MGAANGVWADLEADVVVGAVGHLVSASPTLSMLRRGGIEVRAVRKHSDARLELAAAIGASCGGHPQYARQLVRPRPMRDERLESPPNHFVIKREAAASVATMLRELSALGVCSGFDLMGRVLLSSRRTWIEFAKLPQGVEVSEYRVFRGSVHPDHEDFIRGHWLTAYAYQIALDVVGRTGRPFEIYSGVEYQLAGEVRGGQGSIDVLVRTDDQLLMIKCQPGRFLTAHQNPSPVDAVIHHASKLDQVLTETCPGLTCSYLLVHTGFEPDVEIDHALAARGGAPVASVMPSDLRARITGLATPH